jgi:uncharacterized protein (TIGR03083 family)
MLKELQAITDKLNEERGILDRTLDGLTEEEAAGIKVTPEWSVKDVVAHLVGGERGMTRIARGMSKGEDPKLPVGYNNDEYNARQVGKRQALSLAQVRAELATSRADLLTLIDSITPEQLALCGEHPLVGETSLKDLLVVIYSHETTHGNEIADKIRESKK